MKVAPARIPDVLIIDPRVFGDERGFFLESYNQKVFNEALGQEIVFVQDSHSRSTKNVIRGLHWQVAPKAQGKLVRVVQGEVFDVAVDLRDGSATYGQWVGEILSADNKKQLWIPPGFAHGFLTLSESADFLYKTTEYYSPEHERSLRWNDPTIGISWPVTGEVLLSPKDSVAPFLASF
jgi:dTDP-4-dehydrorhamnose 3,5-epimerase